jgi:hypothetical protein
MRIRFIQYVATFLLLLMNSIQSMEGPNLALINPKVIPQIVYIDFEDQTPRFGVNIPYTSIKYDNKKHQFVAWGPSIDPYKTQMIAQAKSFEQIIKELVSQKKISAAIGIDQIQRFNNETTELYSTPPVKQPSNFFTLVLTIGLHRNLETAIDIACQNMSPFREPEDVVLLQTYWKVLSEFIETDQDTDRQEKEESIYNKFIRQCNKFFENKPINAFSQFPAKIYTTNKEWFINALRNSAALPVKEPVNKRLLFDKGDLGWGYIAYLQALFKLRIDQDKTEPNIRQKILDQLEELAQKFNSGAVKISKEDLQLLFIRVFEEGPLPRLPVPQPKPQAINPWNLSILQSVLVNSKSNPNFVVGSMIDLDALSAPSNPSIELLLRQEEPTQRAGSEELANQQETGDQPPPKNPQPPQPTEWKKYIPHFTITATAVALLGAIGFVIKRNLQSIQQWGWVQRLMQKMRRVNK